MADAALLDAPTGPLSVFRDDDLFRISVDNYHQMIDAAILGEDDPVELLEGILFAKEPEPTNPSIILRGNIHKGYLHRLSIQQYHDMIDEGIIGPRDRVELLEGILVKKMAMNPPHVYSSEVTRDRLNPLLPPGWFLNTEKPIQAGDTEPEPDVSAIRGTRDDYRSRIPGAADSAMLVEVADSSLAIDREKRKVFARSGYVIYWIINLVDRQIEVYTQPSGPCDAPDYGHCQVYKENDSVPVVIDGNEVGRIAVKDVLP